jgi:hypothetical protein
MNKKTLPYQQKKRGLHIHLQILFETHAIHSYCYLRPLDDLPPPLDKIDTLLRCNASTFSVRSSRD